MSQPSLRFVISSPSWLMPVLATAALLLLSQKARLPPSAYILTLLVSLDEYSYLLGNIKFVYFSNFCVFSVSVVEAVRVRSSWPQADHSSVVSSTNRQPPLRTEARPRDCRCRRRTLQRTLVARLPPLQKQNRLIVGLQSKPQYDKLFIPTPSL